MIRALWFMVKTALLVAVAVWVAQRPGTISVEWMDYTARVHVGFFLLLLLMLIVSAIYLHVMINWVLRAPQAFRAYRARRRREKGYRALTLGLTAVAAGDAKAASRQAGRATMFLPEDKGLPILLQAQAARLEGREEEARQSFLQLLENKDTSFLGVRGLLQAALDARNHEKALALARQALKIHPKQPWILKLVYELEIRQREWDAARQTLVRAEKAGAVPIEQAVSDIVAILLAEADVKLDEGSRKDALFILKKAQNLDPAFVPTVKRLANMYIHDGKRRAAVRLIEKAWKTGGHPDLAALWESLIAPRKAGHEAARLKWMKKLVDFNPEAADGHVALARTALAQKLWGAAREHLQKAEEIAPSMRIYKLLAEMEERVSGDPAVVRAWRDKAETAPLDKVWVCRETGRVYEEWMPIAEPHGSFNTIIWDSPQSGGKFLVQDHLKMTALDAPTA